MDYTVVRSKRKTLSLSVNRDGEIVVRAPFTVHEEEILLFLYRHRAWIEKQLTLRDVHPRFADGEIVSLCGRNYQIVGGTRAKLEGETLILPAENREEAFAALLRRLTRARMQKFLDEICGAYGLTYTRLSVTGARSRWGSCGTNRHIAFTFRTAFLPDDLAYYLAVHELCHTRHMDHGKDFWKEVYSILPGYRALRARLKSYLWVMDCL